MVWKKKRRAKALKARQRREGKGSNPPKNWYKYFFETAQECFCLLSPEGKFVAINGAVERLTGWSRSEMLGRRLKDFLHPEDLNAIAGGVKRFLREKLISPRELRFRSKSGEYLDAEFLSQAWVEKGKLKGFFGIIRKATAPKRAEQSLSDRSKLEKILSDLSTYFINLPQETLEPGINYALQEIGGFFGVDCCGLFLFSEDKSRFSLSYEWCAEGIEPQKQNLQNLSGESLRWLVQTLRRNEVFHLPCVQEFPLKAKAEKKLFRNKTLKSVICIPIFYGGGLGGFLALGSIRSERIWEEDTILMLRLIGEIFANLLARQEYEKSLLESQEQYRLTLDAMGDMIHMVDRDLKFLLFNTAFQKMNRQLGLETNVLGKTVREVFPFLAKKVEEEYQRVLSTGKPLVTEEVIKIGEQTFYTETRKIPILERGRVTRIVTVVRDITEQKRLESALRESMERYQALVKLLPESLVVMDLQGNILDLSERALELHGYKKKEELLGKSGYVLVAPEHRERVAKLMEKIFSVGVIKNLESLLLKKDGSRVKAVMSFSLLKDEQGRATGLLGIAQVPPA